MESQINKIPHSFWKEREAAVSPQNANQVKSAKGPKSGKKPQEKSPEEAFLASEYFKHRSGNKSSLSFCSGDNGENRWTVDSGLGLPFRPKGVAFASPPNDGLKSDAAVPAEKEGRERPAKPRRSACHARGDPREQTERLLEGILSGKGRLDGDLVTLVTEQMFLAERELQITRTHLIETISKLNERDLEIIRLREKIQSLQGWKKTDATTGEDERPSKSCDDYQRLVTASEKLKKQVQDMEEFLNDYGLVWVGDKETNRRPDFDKIIKSFERLNSVASQPKIIQTTLGAKFELPRGIPVILYSNGILVRNNDFREYNKVSTTWFLQDVEDGYFPGELQAEFPEGVPFEVFDKRNEAYNQNGKIPVFQGRGNRLGSTFEGRPSSVVYLEPVKQTTVRDSYSPLPKNERSDRSPLRKLQKKRSRNFSVQEDTSSISTSLAQKPLMQNEYETRHSQGRRLRVKIRYGKEKTESFVLEIKEGEKMAAFQKSLQQKLCERFHDECIVSDDSSRRPADFEIHVYGSTPFRLSDRLHVCPKDCGILDNSLINVTEI